MNEHQFFFAGGGTGGHIYPALAVAERIREISFQSSVFFFCSERAIDQEILSKTTFPYETLPAGGLSLKPKALLNFCRSFWQSYKIARAVLHDKASPVVVGIGGFIAAPVALAAHRLGIPVCLINVDIVPGKSNKLIARWANTVFVQFPDTADYFRKKQLEVVVSGCPLREEFQNPQPQQIIRELGLDPDKKILVITGASSGSMHINETICSLLDQLAAFKDTWQIVHLTGHRHIESVRPMYQDSPIQTLVIDYCDRMADLLSAADLVIGRSGAVSIAEYTAAAVPLIAMPYPYHKDRHQYLNAEKLVKIGAAIIVDDLPDETDRRQWLWEELEPLMKDPAKLAQMKQAAESIQIGDAATQIAESLLSK